MLIIEGWEGIYSAGGCACVGYFRAIEHFGCELSVGYSMRSTVGVVIKVLVPLTVYNIYSYFSCKSLSSLQFVIN
jgi:hypothetical protein